MAVFTPSPLQIVCHDSPGDQWNMVFGEPDPRLPPHVMDYCGYHEQTTTFQRRIEPPGARAGLIVNFGPPVAVHTNRTGSAWQRRVNGRRQPP